MTSIYPPSEAVRKFASMGECRLYVAGDRKTPEAWREEGVRLISPEDQEQSSSRLLQILPWNHYCRKQAAYLRAIEEAAEIIVDSDDDNIPKVDWSFPPFTGTFAISTPDCGFVNVYQAFTAQFIWPRGLPLDRILHPDSFPIVGKQSFASVGVWQALADGDPDVDAIYRLTNNQSCNFDDRPPLVLDQGTLCPFNSQNTAFRKEVFPLLYLPALVNFRYTDILRGLIAQPILWAAGYRLGFTKATVVQKRNPHDYLKDFESEMPCYLYPQMVATEVSNSVSPNDSITGNLKRAYANLVKARLVPSAEMEIVEAWLYDLKELGIS